MHLSVSHSSCAPHCQQFYPPSYLGYSFSWSLTKWYLFPFLLYLIIFISSAHLMVQPIVLTQHSSNPIHKSTSGSGTEPTNFSLSVIPLIPSISSIPISMNHLYTNSFSDIFNSLDFFLPQSYSAGNA